MPGRAFPRDEAARCLRARRRCGLPGAAVHLAGPRRRRRPRRVDRPPVRRRRRRRRCGSASGRPGFRRPNRLAAILRRARTTMPGEGERRHDGRDGPCRRGPDALHAAPGRNGSRAPRSRHAGGLPRWRSREPPWPAPPRGVALVEERRWRVRVQGLPARHPRRHLLLGHALRHRVGQLLSVPARRARLSRARPPRRRRRGLRVVVEAAQGSPDPFETVARWRHYAKVARRTAPHGDVPGSGLHRLSDGEWIGFEGQLDELEQGAAALAGGVCARWAELARQMGGEATCRSQLTGWRLPVAGALTDASDWIQAPPPMRRRIRRTRSFPRRPTRRTTMPRIRCAGSAEVAASPTSSSSFAAPSPAVPMSCAGSPISAPSGRASARSTAQPNWSRTRPIRGVGSSDLAPARGRCPG